MATREQIEAAALAEKFRSAGRKIKGKVEEALNISALLVERDAKKNTPVKTGRLQGSISHRVVDRGSSTFAEVGTNVEYAMAVHEGSSRHPNPRPFLRKAAIDNKAKIKRFMKEALKNSF